MLGSGIKTFKPILHFLFFSSPNHQICVQHLPACARAQIGRRRCDSSIVTMEISRPPGMESVRLTDLRAKSGRMRCHLAVLRELGGHRRGRGALYSVSFLSPLGVEGWEKP